MSNAGSIKFEDAEVLKSYIAESTHATLSALTLCRAGIGDNGVGADYLAGIEALLEKAGAISDKAATLLGEMPIVGEYEDWLAGEKPEAAAP